MINFNNNANPQSIIYKSKQYPNGVDINVIKLINGETMWSKPMGQYTLHGVPDAKSVVYKSVEGNNGIKPDPKSRPGYVQGTQPSSETDTSYGQYYTECAFFNDKITVYGGWDSHTGSYVAPVQSWYVITDGDQKISLYTYEFSAEAQLNVVTPGNRETGECKITNTGTNCWLKIESSYFQSPINGRLENIFTPGALISPKESLTYIVSDNDWDLESDSFFEVEVSVVFDEEGWLGYDGVSYGENKILTAVYNYVEPIIPIIEMKAASYYSSSTATYLIAIEFLAYKETPIKIEISRYRGGDIFWSYTVTQTDEVIKLNLDTNLSQNEIAESVAKITLENGWFMEYDIPVASYSDYEGAPRESYYEENFNK